jgi:Dyp-type peroxidase family
VNRAGLAALLPIEKDKERLGELLDGLPRGAASPFARIEATHFARLTVLRDEACLFFAAEFDMTPEGYLEAMCLLMPDDADRIFGCCDEYPGTSAPPAFRTWMFERRVKPGFSIHGNPDATVDRIRRSLAVRKRLIAFATEHRGADPDALWQAWKRAWPAPRPAPASPYRPGLIRAGLRPEPCRERSPVQQADLQGNVLCGYGRDFGHGLYLFARVRDARAARVWIGERASDVTTALPWRRAPAHTLNLAFTWEGLRALGAPERVLDSFPDRFKEGMRARAGELGDVGPSAPGEWDADLGRIHMLLTVTAPASSPRDERQRVLERALAAAGFEVSARVRTAFLPDGREPFGFRDGVSQPAIRDPHAGPHPRDPEIRPGEFVLGYEDEGGCIAAGPRELGSNGSYMVVRKLEQDVSGFWDFVRAQAGPDRERQEWLAAKLVGRWRDGTPLELSPDLPPARMTDDLVALNDFGYAADSDGFRCPIGAHIRRANPRDALDPRGRLARRHRIIRRGMPLEPTANDGRPGLMFVCFQASIARQFEFVQRQWLGAGDVFGIGDDADPLVGPGGGKMTFQGTPPTLLGLERFVTTRGGDYFFVPGIAALGRIATARDWR